MERPARGSGPDMVVDIDPSRVDETDRNVVVGQDGTAYTRAHPEIDVYLSTLRRLCIGTTLDWIGGAAHASREAASPVQTVPETGTGGLVKYNNCPLGLRLAYPQTGRVTEPPEPHH